MGEDYRELPRTISIAILDFDLKELKEIPEFYTEWKIIENKYRKIILTSKFNFYIIELSKLRRLPKKELNDKLTQWMLFLDNPKSMEVETIMKSNKDIEKAMKTLHEIQSDKELMRIIGLREKAIHDEVSRKNYWKEKFEELDIREERLKKRDKELSTQQQEVEDQKKEVEDQKKEVEDQKKEIEDQKKEVEDQKKEIEEKGKEEGKQEKAIEIAKKLLQQNIDIVVIGQTTGLSIDEINKLRI